VWKSLNGFRGKDLPQIYVVDYGSTDNTPEILRRICRDYEFIKVFTREEYISLMEKIK
jgi:cellulose synthase/poly-beta-1,6-N-acetylglucosamine synthase-like glycosyltransferase